MFIAWSIVTTCSLGLCFFAFWGNLKILPFLFHTLIIYLTQYGLPLLFLLKITYPQQWGENVHKPRFLCCGKKDIRMPVIRSTALKAYGMEQHFLTPPNRT
jgi:hypothetical protein